MNIVLPIVFASVIMGLFAKRMTPLLWVGLGLWIAVVIAGQFVKSH